MSLKSRLKAKRRPGEPWISRNRVLNGGTTSKHRRNCPTYRNPNFDTDETKLLIQLWGDPKVQRELITTHKKHVVISQLATKMEEYGYYRSPEEITTRIKNMKCFYNRLKKELEPNNGTATWRHYAEMDAIMTRPIFSVRPNEVPAPSLKYLLEQEQEKRKERKRQAEEDGDPVSESDEDISDILAVPNAASPSQNTLNKTDNSTNDLEDLEPDAEFECEVDDRTLAALENATENDKEQVIEEDENQNKNGQTISDAELAIKMEIESEEFQEHTEDQANDQIIKNTSNTNKTEESNKIMKASEQDDLLVPKAEPIDVDEEFEDIAKQATPTAKTATTTTLTNLVDILKQPPQQQAQPTFIKFAMPNNSTATSITSSSAATNSTIATQSKISVVSPTILMSSQMSPKSTVHTSTETTATNMPQRQVRLGGNLHALLAASGSRTTTVTNANGMKFLLVNSGDQRGPPITTSTLTSAINMNRTAMPNQTSMKIIPNTTQQFQQPQQQMLQMQQQQQQQNMQQQQQKPQAPILKPKEPLKRIEPSKDYKERLKKRDLQGIKTTLLRMVKVQEDANEIESERLTIERERLQYERTIADKFLNMFEQNQKFQQQMLQQLQQQQQQSQLQQHFQIQQRPTTSQIFTTNAGSQNIQTQQGQMMLPPKLLITTMVPNSGAQAVAAGGASAASTLTSKVLTTSGFANLAAKQNNDIQLLIPKEEPQN